MPATSTADHVSVRLGTELREDLAAYAEAIGANTSQAIRLILETFLRSNDPKFSRERVALAAAMKEGMLSGYAIIRQEFEVAFGRGLNRVELAERQIYRSKYKAGQLTDADRDTAVVRAMEKRGDFDELDREKEKSQRQPKRRLTPAQRDAQELLGPGAMLNGTPPTPPVTDDDAPEPPEPEPSEDP